MLGKELSREIGIYFYLLRPHGGRRKGPNSRKARIGKDEGLTPITPYSQHRNSGGGRK